MKFHRLTKKNTNCLELMMKTNPKRRSKMKLRMTRWRMLKMTRTVLIITLQILTKLTNLVKKLKIKSPNLMSRPTLKLNL